MYIQCYNNISDSGLQILREASYSIVEECDDPHAIILRSHKLSLDNLSPGLLAIGRAGVGVNNIPVDVCNSRGIAVFNSPGANANAVKELVLAGMLLSSRNILSAIEFSKTLVGKGDLVPSLVESGKSQFKGSELKHKSFGVIGLGAIGVTVANMAVGIGMSVLGHDPFITVNSAWGLSSYVEQAENLKSMLQQTDYISVHVPLTDHTTSFINHDLLTSFKQGSVLLNFSRSEIVDEEAILASLESGHLALYVTDFPTENLLKSESVLCIPHLGASTIIAQLSSASTVDAPK